MSFNLMTLNTQYKKLMLNYCQKKSFFFKHRRIYKGLNHMNHSFSFERIKIRNQRTINWALNFKKFLNPTFSII